jgi:hypothetical protein
MECSSDSEDFEWESNLECGVDINPPSGSDLDSELETLLEPSSRAPVIAGELEGSRRDCNTMEKQRGRR